MATNSKARKLLVIGATGKQGTALISALGFVPSSSSTSDPNANSDLTQPQPQFRILALTRNAHSPSAKHLASLHENIKMVEGDLDDPVSIRRVFENTKEEDEDGGGIWGVFSVLAFPGLGANADGVERQGKTLADLAFEFGVSCFVYSSYERGGESYDDRMVLDRHAKVMIERHIRELGDKGLNWTILRPAFFMENFEGTIGAITYGVLKAGLKPDTTVQLIAVDDIGHVASAVFKAPEQYASQILSVVGDICTTADLDTAHRSATEGRAMPAFPGFLARLIIRINKHTQHLIADLERVHILRTDPSNEENRAQMAAAREAYRDMMTFASWAGRTGAKGRKVSTKKGWNQVTLGRLLTGKL